MHQKSTPSFFLGSMRKIPSRPISPNPNSQFVLSKSNQITFGEAVEELQCFWYVSFQLPEQNPDQDDSSDDEPTNSVDEIWGRPIRNDWGIHVNSDCLFEKAAILATRMEDDNIGNATNVALWLYFAFGFQHEYFHHVVDSQIAMHESRLGLDSRTEDMDWVDDTSKKLRIEYLQLYNKYMVNREGVDWWLFVEEALANASVIIETSQLSDLQHIFIHYGLLPTPGNTNSGPYALWEDATEPECWDLFSSFVWLQHLQMSHDPLGMIDGIKTIKKQSGSTLAYQKFGESLKNISEYPMLKETIKMKGKRSNVKNAGFGDFNPQSGGLLSRLDIPIIIHGSRREDLLHLLDNEWPHRTIEHLYNAFSRTNHLSEDPFSDDDDVEFVA